MLGMRIAQPELRLSSSEVVALQRTAGNVNVSALVRERQLGPMRPRPADDRHVAADAAISTGLARAVQRAPAPAAEGEVRVVERLPTIPEPGVKYVIGAPERRYDFAVTLEGKLAHYRNLTPAQAVEKLRQIWWIVHSDLDDGRAENHKLRQQRKEHRTAGYWSDLAGGTEVPDPAMWDGVGRGTLSEVLTVLDSTDAALKDLHDRYMAGGDRNLPAALEHNPLMKAALAFDAAEERIRRASALLERAAYELSECQKQLDRYRGDTATGAGRAITVIKVSIVVLSSAAGGAGAEFAGAEAGLLAQAAYGAGTMGIVGAADETFTQVGEIRIGERERLDVARIGKRAARDVVTGFVGGVAGGKFSQVLKSRIGAWTSGLSDEALVARGLTREQLLGNGERLFAEWVGGSILASPFTTTAGHLMDRALDGKWKVHTFGEFLNAVIDDMIRGAKMGGFLTYASHAVNGGAGTGANAGRVKPPNPLGIESAPKGGFRPEHVTAEPVRENYGPAPEQVELTPAEAMPVRETRNLADPGKTRKVHTSVVEVETAVQKALKLLAKKGKAANPKPGRRPIDALIAEIARTDREFAGKVRRYYDALDDVTWVEAQMVHLWEQAAEHQRTTAKELEHILGSGTKGINEFRNVKTDDPYVSFADFKKTLLDARPLVDLSSAGDHHGSHTHAFQQYLGDRLFGPGGGLEFRQKLAELQGPTKTRRSGQRDEYEEPFWAQVWDELFDDSDNLHSPEEIGKILQRHLDFPRWDPNEKTP
jgi:hypothetical protein